MSARGIENAEGTEGSSVIAGAWQGVGVRKKDAYIFFGVYAPSADSVWLVGSFNDWNETHPMTKGNGGVWVIRLAQSDIPYGTVYKYKVYVDGEAEYLPDPYAIETDGYPYHNSVYRDTPARVRGSLGETERIACRNTPLSIYRLRLDSLFCNGQEGDAPDYVSLAHELLPYLLQMGYTHVSISGMSERYYDLGKDYMTNAGFVVRSRQGGADFLRELVRILRSAGMGIFVELDLENTFGDDLVDMDFHTDNALYWLDLCLADGVLIYDLFGRREKFLTRLIHNIKTARAQACIAIYSGCGIKGSVADVAVCRPTKYMSLFKDAKTQYDTMYARAAAMTCLLLGDGRMLTLAGDEFADFGDFGENFKSADQNEELKARFQLFCSELNAIYAGSPCFWSELAHSHVIKRSGGCFSIKKALDGEEFAVIVDISGGGAEIRVGGGKWRLLLDSRKALGARECAAMAARGDKTALRLPPYGAVILRKENFEYKSL